MRTITLSPAGRQPVRIARYMAVGQDLNVLSNPLSFSSKYARKAIACAKRKAFALCTWANVRIAVATASALCAFFAGIDAEDGSTSSLITLAVATVAFYACLFPAFMKKGGRL